MKTTKKLSKTPLRRPSKRWKFVGDGEEAFFGDIYIGIFDKQNGWIPYRIAYDTGDAYTPGFDKSFRVRIGSLPVEAFKENLIHEAQALVEDFIKSLDEEIAKCQALKLNLRGQNNWKEQFLGGKIDFIELEVEDDLCLFITYHYDNKSDEQRGKENVSFNVGASPYSKYSGKPTKSKEEDAAYDVEFYADSFKSLNEAKRAAKKFGVQLINNRIVLLNKLKGRAELNLEKVSKQK